MNLEGTYISKPSEEKFSMTDKLTAKSDSQGAMEELSAQAMTSLLLCSASWAKSLGIHEFADGMVDMDLFSLCLYLLEIPSGKTSPHFIYFIIAR